jgi:signal transduction histidine kinase
MGSCTAVCRRGGSRSSAAVREAVRRSSDWNFSTAGTGIGLAIVRRAAQKIDATLRMESVVGEGSTFYLGLPGSIADSAHP